MKTFITRILIVGLLAGLVAGAPLVSQAAEKKAKTESAEKQAKSDRVPIHGKIGAVDTVNKTITLEGKEKNRVLQVKSDTKLTKDGQPATFDAAVVGEEVGGQVRKVDENKFDAISLRFGPKPEGKSEAKSKKKAASKKEAPTQTQ